MDLEEVDDAVGHGNVTAAAFGQVPGNWQFSLVWFFVHVLFSPESGALERSVGCWIS